MGRIELPEFTFVGLQWRFLCFPRGNNNEAHVSVYLDYLGPKKEPWWGFPVQFVLTPHSEDDELTFSNSKGLLVLLHANYLIFNFFFFFFPPQRPSIASQTQSQIGALRSLSRRTSSTRTSLASVLLSTTRS